MIELPGLVRRHVESLVTEALADTRVVLVNGARQAGKSTLTRLAADRRPDAVIRMLDDPATLQAATDDPTGFVDRTVGTPKLAFVDTGVACHDAVIEASDGRVIGIEVKSGATVRTEDLAGLRSLTKVLGDRFVAG
ncbi:MAG: hypothetical protein ACRDSR_13255 [Pseudonocardiaceae bacterium]